MKSKIEWYLRQLLPLSYISEYRADGKRKVTYWRMWFGRCFSVRTWVVA